MWMDVQETGKNDPFSDMTEPERDTTPIPGRFPIEDGEGYNFIENHISHGNPPSPPPSRPAKRIQRDKGVGDSELKSSWVLIAPKPVSNHSSRSSLEKQNSFSPSRLPRPSSPYSRRTSTANAASMATSRTTTRKSTHNYTTSTTSSAAARRSPATQSYSPTPRQATTSTTRTQAVASFASYRLSPRASSTRQRQSSSGGPGISGLSPVAQRLAEKRRREEKEQEESMERFNARLRKMIREGKEALGSTVVIEDDVS